jgi:Zn-dependent M28 family amino/carboxypeptidase
LAAAVAASVALAAATPPDPAAERLVDAVLGDTPLIDDLRRLTDEVGGRPTGSEANMAAVEWAEARFREAGVAVRREPFEMPAFWLERSAAATVSTPGGEISFSPRVAAMPFSTATPPEGLAAPLVNGGRGGEADFAALGEAARGAFVLIATDELLDVPGLFAEYERAPGIETRAFDAGAAGVIYMGSRPRDVLYRHNASRGPDNRHPLLIMERTAAQRTLRLLEAGRTLEIRVRLDLETGGPYTSWNVVGEIPGSAEPEEFVVLGAHLDSWGLGTGALDNGCNVALVIDLARQMRRLGLTPRRTIRFALFNGEEQGLQGSWGYVQTHAGELDRHVMASSYDIGSGRIEGFFTGGRPEVLPVLEAALAPVRFLGPFVHDDVPIVGTDNYDFMMEGIANLVASQASANYGPNYHAGTDTFDKVDLVRLRLNAAVAAAVTWGFANQEIPRHRQTRAEIQHLIDTTDLGEQMRTFGVWEGWEDGTRGRRE